MAGEETKDLLNYVKQNSEEAFQKMEKEKVSLLFILRKSCVC